MSPRLLIFTIVLLEIGYLTYSSTQQEYLTSTLTTSVNPLNQYYKHPEGVLIKVQNAVNFAAEINNYLDISHLKLQYVPSLVFNSKNNFTGINLKGNRLKFFPSSLKKFTDISRLNLNLNNISEIPDDIKYFKNLKDILLQDNYISTISEEITTIETLQSIILDDNPISQLPDLSKLPNLKHLSVKRTELSENDLKVLQQQLPHLEIISDYDLTKYRPSSFSSN